MTKKVCQLYYIFKEDAFSACELVRVFSLQSPLKRTLKVPAGWCYQTYFLNTVDEADLLAAAEAAGVELASCSCSDKCAAGAVNTDCAVCAVNMTECAGVEQKPEPEPEPVAEPDAEPETEKGNAGMLLLVLAVAVLGGGAAFYFKVYRPKQQAATEPEEDYGEELEDYDGEEDGPPWDEDEDENEDTEDGE